MSACVSVVLHAAADNDAHIALGGSPVRHNFPHWEVVLGGWANRRCAIRVFNQGPELACHEGAVLGGSAHAPRSFWISWADSDVFEWARGTPSACRS